MESRVCCIFLRTLAALCLLAVFPMTPSMAADQPEQVVRPEIERRDINEADIDALEQIDARIDEAIDSHNVDYISLHNQAFHRHLYQANPFQIAVPLIESLWLQLGPFSRIAISKLEKTYLVDRHVEALEALRQRNLFGLRCAIEADIRDGIASINTVEGIHSYFQGVA